MEDDIVPRPSTAPVADNLRKCRGEKRADHGAAAKPDDDDDDDDDGGKAKKKGRGYKDNAVGVIVVDSGDEENDVRARVPKKMLPTPFKGSVAAALMSHPNLHPNMFDMNTVTDIDNDLQLYHGTTPARMLQIIETGYMKCSDASKGIWGTRQLGKALEIYSSERLQLEDLSVKVAFGIYTCSKNHATQLKPKRTQFFSRSEFAVQVGFIVFGEPEINSINGEPEMFD